VKEAPRKPGFETLAIHAGQEPEAVTGAVVVPIFQTSTFAQEAVGKHKGYEYARTGNPTRTALETCLAALEGGRWGLAFASGMAATDAVAHLLSKGDHVVMTDDVYGGTYRLFSKVFARLGIGLTVVDMRKPEAAKRAMRPRTKLPISDCPARSRYCPEADFSASSPIIGSAYASSWLALISMKIQVKTSTQIRKMKRY